MAWAETLHPVSRDLVCEGLSGRQQGGRGWDGTQGESWEGWAVSHWLLSQFPLPHGGLVAGGLVSGALLQAERQEADPSSRKETECPPGPQWTDWTTRTGGKYNSLLINAKKEGIFLSYLLICFEILWHNKNVYCIVMYRKINTKM